MAEPSLTTLIVIDDENEGRVNWSEFVDGKDGFLYGIPCDARRVVKFNPVDNSLTEIGPDLGVRAKNGSIYCAPSYAERMLKINTNDGTVETLLDNVEWPETGDYLWQSGALATDNNIYYMPFNARRIMKLNPGNESLSSVGDDLGEGRWKYSGTVVGNDDCVYGIPHHASHIIKFDPANPETTSSVGEEDEEGFYCGNGVLGGDGFIYAANPFGQVLQIDTEIIIIPGLGMKYFHQESERDGVTILLELISVFTGLHAMPIMYSNLTLRHNNHHHSWGMTWVKKVTNGSRELWQRMGLSIISHTVPNKSSALTHSRNFQ